MRKPTLAAFAIVVLAGGIPAEAQAEQDRVGYGERVSRKIVKHIRGTHFCQMKMERPRTKVRLLFTKQSIHRRRYVLRVWIERHDDTCDALRKYRRQRASRVSLPWAFWNCVATGRLPSGAKVSHGEGGVDSYNPYGPYFGRYQMDWGFMRNHGSDMLRKYGGRDARSWTLLDQTIVAERGYRVQGAGAWPNTAPPCLSAR